MKKKTLPSLSSTPSLLKKLFGIVVISVFLFSGAFSASAASESIENFRADIDIYQDGQVLVREIINYNFADNERHGIFRDIPLTAKEGPTLIIDVQSVADENNLPYNYTVSNDGNAVQIKIGDANKTITGVHAYHISYRVKNAIRSFDDHEELYWNVTGNAWNVPIKQASAVVNIVQGGIVKIQAKCFTGRRDSQDENCSTANDLVSNFFSSSQTLNPREGLTLVYGFPLGIIQNTYFEPPEIIQPQNLSNSFIGTTILIILWPLVLIIIIFSSIIRGFKRGFIKPKPVIPRSLKDRPITVQYNPPENLTPLEIGTILDRRVDPADLSAVIVDLAIQGYLKIKYITTPIPILPDKKHFELVKLKDGHDIKNPFYQEFFNILFDGRDTVKIGSWGSDKIIGSKIQSFIKDLENNLYDQDYFSKKRQRSNLAFILAPLIITAILFVVEITLENIYQFYFSTNIYYAVIIIIFVFFQQVAIIFGDTISTKGTETLSHILGFKEFLELTEKDKLELLNAPHLEPETFEKFLPYAMVLRVENDWANKFENIYTRVPEWYEDQNMTTFNSIYLTSNLNTFNTSFNKSFKSSTSSSSGFSGGSSGGGSGGGGGGSW